MLLRKLFSSQDDPKYRDDPILTVCVLAHNPHLVAFSEPRETKETLFIYDLRRDRIALKLLEDDVDCGKIVSVVSLDPNHVGVHYNDANFRVWDLRDRKVVLTINDLYSSQQHHPLLESTIVLSHQSSDEDNEIQIVDWRDGRVINSTKTQDHFLFWSFEYSKNSEERLVTYGNQTIMVWKIFRKTKKLVSIRRSKLKTRNFFGVSVRLRNGDTLAAIPTNLYGYIDIVDFEISGTPGYEFQITENKGSKGVYFVHSFPGNVLCTLGETRKMKFFKLDEESMKFELKRSYKLSYDYCYGMDILPRTNNLVVCTCDPSEIAVFRTPFLPSSMTEEESKNSKFDNIKKIEFLLSKMNMEEELVGGRDEIIQLIFNDGLKTRTSLNVWKALLVNSKLFPNFILEKKKIIVSSDFISEYSLDLMLFQLSILGEDLRNCSDFLFRSEDHILSEIEIIELFSIFKFLGMEEHMISIIYNIENLIPMKNVLSLLCLSIQIFEGSKIEEIGKFEEFRSPFTQGVANWFLENCQNLSEVENNWVSEDTIPVNFEECLDINVRKIYSSNFGIFRNTKLFCKTKIFEVCREVMFLRSKFFFSMTKFSGLEAEELESKGTVTIELLSEKEMDKYLSFVYTREIDFNNLESKNNVEILFKLLQHGDLFFEYELYYYCMMKLHDVFFQWLREEELGGELFSNRVSSIAEFAKKLPTKSQVEIVDFFQIYFSKSFILDELKFDEEVFTKFEFADDSDVESEGEEED